MGVICEIPALQIAVSSAKSLPLSLPKGANPTHRHRISTTFLFNNIPAFSG
jgi:hypothetical protein